MEQDDQQSEATPGRGGLPGSDPGGQPGYAPSPQVPITPATPAGPAGPAGPTGPGTAVDGPRPLPLITSLAGAAGALFLLVSLALFLSEVGSDNRRMGGLLACLLFQALGVGLMVITRGRATTTAGVGLTALAVIPLVIYLFVDVDNPGKTINSPSDFTSTATTVLIASAAAWLVAYFFGPGRRYGIYLGGALVALWLISVVQIVDNPINQIFNPFETRAQFIPIGDTIEPDYGSSDPYAFEDFGTDEYYEDDFFSDTSDGGGFSSPSQDDFGQGFDDDFSYEDEYSYEDPYADLEDPSTKLGWASLLFGGSYLALAAWRDRRGDGRMGTPLVAVSAPILLFAISFLSGDFGDTGTSMLAIAIGAAQIFVGTRTGRRFTSWLGLLVVTIGVVTLVEQAVGDSATVSAIVLLILGVGITLLALALEGGLTLGRGDGPAGPAGPGFVPGGTTGPPAGATPPSGPPWAAPGDPAGPPPTAGPPWAAPATPPTGGPQHGAPWSPHDPTTPTPGPGVWTPPAPQAPSPQQPPSPPADPLADLWGPPAGGQQPPSDGR